MFHRRPQLRYPLNTPEYANFGKEGDNSWLNLSKIPNAQIPSWAFNMMLDEHASAPLTEEEKSILRTIKVKRTHRTWNRIRDWLRRILHALKFKKSGKGVEADAPHGDDEDHDGELEDADAERVAHLDVCDDDSASCYSDDDSASCYSNDDEMHVTYAPIIREK
jgi:hypothetical protein